MPRQSARAQSLPWPLPRLFRASLFEPGVAHRLQRGNVGRGAGQFDLRAQLRGDFFFHRHLVLVEQALVGADRLVAASQAQVGVAQLPAGVDLSSAERRGGKSVDVRVDLGGRRHITKTKKNKLIENLKERSNN